MEQSTLRVRLVRGEGLPSADSNGLSDPYVVFTLDGEQKKKSNVVKKTLNPDWSQDFMFDEKLGEYGSNLYVEVYDKDALSSDFLGRGTVHVYTLQQGKNEVTVDLHNPKKENEDCGRVYLILERTRDKVESAKEERRENQVKGTSGIGIGSMVKSATKGAVSMVSRATQFHPQGGKGVKRMVTVDVIKARGVPVMDINGFSDPYIKVKVGKKTRTTRTQFRTLSPEWRERFIFVVFDMGGRDSPMAKVELWDKDTVGMDDKIGKVEVDLSHIPLGQTNETWWKVTRHESRSVFGFGGKKKAPKPGDEGPDPEILLLITVADLFEPQLPADELALAKKASKGWLKAHIIKAVDLPAMDSNGFSDPFVVIEVGNRHMRSHTVKRSLNPEWDVTLECEVKDIFECAYVYVYDEDDNGKFELIGSLCIPLLSIQNGISKWYQLKDVTLLLPGQGCLKMALHLHYLKIPMVAKCISRRTQRHMERPEEFKFKILKENINRIKAFFMVFLHGGIMLNRAMTWQIDPATSVGFFVGWTIVWMFIQFWHIFICICIVTLLRGMIMIRGSRSSSNSLEMDQEEEEEIIEEEIEEDEDDEDAKPKNSAGLYTQIRQMKVMAKGIQNTLGTVASYIERVKNLFNWESPLLTGLMCTGLFVASLLLAFVPIRYFIMLFGWNRMLFSGLRKYHPKFKRSPYHQPVLPPLEYLGRVPDDLEVIQRRQLPVPDGLD